MPTCFTLVQAGDVLEIAEGPRRGGGLRLPQGTRAVEVPDGILLRYTRLPALYFYLRSGVRDGKLATQVYASDSPYDRQKTAIGEARTPLFESENDAEHLAYLRDMLRSWVLLVGDAASDQEFLSYPIRE